MSKLSIHIWKAAQYNHQGKTTSQFSTTTNPQEMIKYKRQTVLSVDKNVEQPGTAITLCGSVYYTFALKICLSVVTKGEHGEHVYILWPSSFTPRYTSNTTACSCSSKDYENIHSSTICNRWKLESTQYPLGKKKWLNCNVFTQCNTNQPQEWMNHNYSKKILRNLSDIRT